MNFFLVVNGVHLVKEYSGAKKTAYAKIELTLENKTIIFLTNSIFLEYTVRLRSPQDGFWILCAIFEKIVRMSKNIIFSVFHRWSGTGTYRRHNGAPRCVWAMWWDFRINSNHFWSKRRYFGSHVKENSTFVKGNSGFPALPLLASPIHSWWPVRGQEPSAIEQNQLLAVLDCSTVESDVKFYWIRCQRKFNTIVGLHWVLGSDTRNQPECAWSLRDALASGERFTGPTFPFLWLLFTMSKEIPVCQRIFRISSFATVGASQSFWMILWGDKNRPQSNRIIIDSSWLIHSEIGC